VGVSETWPSELFAGPPSTYLWYRLQVTALVLPDLLVHWADRRLAALACDSCVRQSGQPERPVTRKTAASLVAAGVDWGSQIVDCLCIALCNAMHNPVYISSFTHHQLHVFRDNKRAKGHESSSSYGYAHDNAHSYMYVLACVCILLPCCAYDQFIRARAAASSLYLLRIYAN
jgi:hypothetical protein